MGTYNHRAVDEWLEYMVEADIDRVLCLLEAAELDEYEVDLLEEYRTTFGDEQVKHAPVPDHATVSPETFSEDILPFLRAADAADERVVVHCSGGSGRTGHVLALWLVTERDYALQAALDGVKATGRTPLEATTKLDLLEILAAAPGTPG